MPELLPELVLLLLDPLELESCEPDEFEPVELSPDPDPLFVLLLEPELVPELELDSDDPELVLELLPEDVSCWELEVESFDEFVSVVDEELLEPLVPVDVASESLFFCLLFCDEDVETMGVVFVPMPSPLLTTLTTTAVRATAMSAETTAMITTLRCTLLRWRFSARLRASSLWAYLSLPRWGVAVPCWSDVSACVRAGVTPYVLSCAPDLSSETLVSARLRILSAEAARKFL